MTTQSLLPTIKQSIIDARTSEPFNKEIYSEKVDAENEFLFFIKPELTLNDSKIQFEDILNMIFEKLQKFSFNIKNIRVINAKYLANHKIINQHYGVISQLSSNLKENISTSAKTKFEEIYEESFEAANVYGSLEALNKFPFLTPTAMSILWQNSPFHKLGGGTYAQKLSFDGKTTFIINGFHPRQVEHFITSDRCIVVMTLVSDTSWSAGRNRLIGKTNPEDAEVGSIRRELLVRKNHFGLDDISSSWNGVHLSAGPIEGLIELMRYNSDFESGDIAKLTDFELGKTLLEAFGNEQTQQLLSNPTISVNGKEESIFDATEELNTKECIELLKSNEI